MKREFTKLMAALALLVGLTIPMGMWGQTNTAEFAPGDFSGQGTSGSGSAISATVNGVTFACDKGYGTTQIRCYSGGVITISSSNTITAISFTFSGSYTGGMETSYTSLSTTSWTKTLSSQARITACTVTYSTGGTPTCATPTFSPAAGAVTSGTEVSISSTEGATIYYTTNGADPTTNSSVYSTPIEITAETTIKAFAIKNGYNPSEIATAAYTIMTPVSGYTIDFESDLGCYVDWEFSNIGIHTSGLTGGAHGGNAWGSNVNESGNATQTASIVTKEIVEYPNVFTCYISKESSNNTASSWKIQVSSDGSSWNDIATLSSMTQNTWTEFTGDIKAAGYTNVYVRLYYSGSNAKRAVDDISLTTYTPVAVETPIINVPAEFTISTTATITCVTEGATIYYSFDNETWNEYTEALTITETKTIYAKAVKGSDESEVAQATTTKIMAVPTVNISSTNINIGETATVSVVETGAPAITLTTSDATVATVSETTVTGVAAGTATITATWSANNDYSAGTKDFTVVVTDPNALGGQNNPYTVAQAIANTPASGTSDIVYIQGTVSGFYKNTIIGDGTNYRYYISDDGTTTTQLLVYKGKGLNEATFTNADDLLVGDEVVICGKLTMFSNAPEVAAGNYLYSWNRPTTPAQQYTLTIGDPDHISITATYGDDMILINGDEAQVLSGTEITLSIIVDEGFGMELTVLDGDNNEITLTADSQYENVWTFSMPNSTVTVNATATEIPVVTPTKYTLATSIESGKQYIIVGQGNGNYYAMGAQRDNNRGAVEISVDGTMATVSDAGVCEFTITSLGVVEGVNVFSIQDAASLGFLYAASSSSNYLRTKEELDENGNGNWAITFATEGGSANIIAQGANTRNVMQYNSGNNIFACYGSASQHPVYLYVKVPTLDITGYGTSTGGYYLIASPVSTTPEAAGMITDELGAQATPETATYDLYSFDQAQELEWINYRQGGFNLEPGKGYLYANKNDVTLTFAGEPSTTSSATLSLSGNGEFAGWNLVGNPFSVPAYIGNRAYYRIGNGGADIVAATPGTAIDVMEGVFVIATEKNEVLNFSTTAAKGASVAMNVVRERGNVIDRAIVRFDEGDQLPKFQLNPNNTKIYVTEGNKDYAVVRSAAEAEMPVNFKAAENGTYTLTVNPEGVEMNYLHLIDNMTGADVDLLATPSYSFEANTRDYANRFKLVFKANTGMEENTATETFAYFNGTNWTVSNVGDATLQVVDMMGRVLSSQTLSGNANISLNQVPGVYVLRLVSGNDVKVQKVVVR